MLCRSRSTIPGRALPPNPDPRDVPIQRQGSARNPKPLRPMAKPCLSDKIDRRGPGLVAVLHRNAHPDGESPFWRSATLRSKASVDGRSSSGRRHIVSWRSSPPQSSACGSTRRSRRSSETCGPPTGSVGVRDAVPSIAASGPGRTEGALSPTRSGGTGKSKSRVMVLVWMAGQSVSLCRSVCKRNLIVPGGAGGAFLRSGQSLGLGG